MVRFEHLFSPIKVGNTVVKNRLWMPPLSTNLGAKGYVTEELINHYRRRAQGGVGLFITEVVTVEPTYVYLPGDMSIHDDSFIEGWSKLAGAVHEYGAKILPQLFHPAFMAFPLPGTPQLIAPSWIGPSYLKQAPREATIEELHTIIRQFGEAAFRAKTAGADGVEIHAAHSHGLLGGFLSPYYNKRTDEYGGDLESRLRLTLEVLHEVRAKCGKDFIIDVRISGDDYQEGGNNLNDMIYVAKRLEEEGADMLHVSGGMTIVRGSAIPAAGTKMGSHADAAREIKKHVSIPVATVGRIHEPWIADELIANASCDAALIGRPNLCDPDFANKAEEGKVDEIRPCIGCLKCLGGIMFGKRIACSVNPSFELVNEDTITEAEEKKNVLVVGAGPAGLEAAYILTKRGHHVRVLEKDATPGGLLKAASVPIAKNDLARLTKYLALRAKQTGIQIEYSKEVTKELLDGEFKDYDVILSTGAKPVVIGSLNNFKFTCTADDLLLGRKNPGRKIVIIGGGAVGCELADWLAPMVNDLAPRNRDITVLEAAPFMMMKDAGAGRASVMKRLMEKGVHMVNNCTVTNVTENEITYTVDGKEVVIKDADTLVFAVGYRPDTTLADYLKEEGRTYHVIGDANTSASVREAISAAFELTKNY